MKPIAQRAKIIIVSFTCAYIAKWIFDYWSADLYARTVVSYEEGWSEYMIQVKIGLMVFSAIVALFSALIYHPTWRVGVLSGVAGALIFRLIDIFIYALVSKAWFEYRGFFTPILSAIAIGALVGFLVVFRQFLRTKAAEQRGVGDVIQRRKLSLSF